jgi:hypothetical protein
MRGPALGAKSLFRPQAALVPSFTAHCVDQVVVVLIMWRVMLYPLVVLLDVIHSTTPPTRTAGRRARYVVTEEGSRTIRTQYILGQ